MRALIALGTLLAGLAGLAVWLGLGAQRPDVPQAQRVTDLLGEAAAAEGFARAVEPARIRLPADHGPHPRFRTEWWYFTGNVDDEAGREFGFQLTFFRFALASEPPVSESRWASNQIYMAHFAITDRAQQRHRVAQRVVRDSLGVAGARATPFAAWLDHWSARSTGAEFLPMRLVADDADESISLDLVVASGKPVVLQGNRGLSQKSTAPGNASYYYSYTRSPAAGLIVIDGEEHRVSGLAWIDREWSTSSLGPDLVGWDWFSVQLIDGHDLMLYALRGPSGAVQPSSAGTLVTADGLSRRLERNQFDLRPADYWRSPATGIRYPVVWEMLVPELALDLIVRAVIPDQEQDLAVRYWEGSVDYIDRRSGRRLGRGYMELTGY
jgi:predicted secreted hydrolase